LHGFAGGLNAAVFLAGAVFFTGIGGSDFFGAFGNGSSAQLA